MGVHKGPLASATYKARVERRHVLTTKEYIRLQKRLKRYRQELFDETNRLYRDDANSDLHKYVAKAYGDIYQACIKVGV